ncbi:MAG: hypothetical protein ABJA82_07980, partial [Myxococcales bacterium]
LEAVDMSGIDDRNHPVTVHARAMVPRIAERTSDGTLLLMMGTRDADLVRTYARLSSRRLDLVLAYPWQHHEVLRYELPAGYAVTSLPLARHVQSKFGSFDLRVRVQEKYDRQDDSQGDRLPRVPPGTVIADARLDVQRDRIPAGDYPAFRKFLADVDAVMAERIVVERASEARARMNSAPPSPAAHDPGPSSDEQPAARGRHQPVVERARGSATP